jgi:hypothetical protein
MRTDEHTHGTLRFWRELDYFEARYYGSNMGRLMSADWSSVPQAVPDGDLSNPQTLDLIAIL